MDMGSCCSYFRRMVLNVTLFPALDVGPEYTVFSGRFEKEQQPVSMSSPASAENFESHP